MDTNTSPTHNPLQGSHFSATQAALEKPWRDAHKRLLALDLQWGKPRFRKAALEELNTYLTTRCTNEPHLSALARIITEDMTRKQLWDILIPVERQLTRTKITDIDILSTDKSELHEPHPLMPFTIVADNFRSAINVGTLFRVSECFGVQDVVLTGYTPDPTDGRAKAAALGTESWVAHRRVQRTSEALKSLQNDNVCCIALETVTGAEPLETFEWTFPCALFLGSERFGLDPDIVVACDRCIQIPVFGRKNSLNVVTAYAIAVHHARCAYEGK